MAKFATTVGNAVLNHLFRIASWTQPAALFVALFNGDPESAGTEISSGAYARQALTMNTAAGKATDNTGAITFPTATANWGNVSYFAVYDASTGGNRLISDQIKDSMGSPVIYNIITGQQVTFQSGQLDVSVS